ncbi:MAG: RNA polymerase sigma factor [Thermomicrobiales bacterium]
MDRSRSDEIAKEPPGHRGTGLTDEQIAGAASNDARYFELLYERYADRLYRYALSRTGSQTEADDIVSETIITALERLEQFDPQRGSFRGWLFAIATRKIADQRRGHRRFWKAINRRWQHDPPGDNAHALALRDDEHRRVHRAIQQLSEANREVVTLRFVADLPIAEIARTLHISEGAAKMRLSRSMRELAKDLGDDIDV